MRKKLPAVTNRFSQYSVLPLSIESIPKKEFTIAESVYDKYYRKAEIYGSRQLVAELAMRMTSVLAMPD